MSNRVVTRRHALFCLLAPFLMPLPRQLEASQSVRLMLQEIPPYALNRRGKAEGFAPDVLHELMSILRISLPIEFTPLPRAVEMLTGDQTVLFGPISRIESNEHKYRWLGPLASNPSMVFRRRSDSPLPENLDALRTAKAIAVGRSSAHLANMSERGFTNLLIVRDIVDSMRRVVRGEAEYAVAGNLTVNSGLDELGIPHALLENTGIQVSELHIYFAMSKATPDMEFEQWQKAFDTLQKTGRIRKLLHKYFDDAVIETQSSVIQ